LTLSLNPVCSVAAIVINDPTKHYCAYNEHVFVVPYILLLIIENIITRIRFLSNFGVLSLVVPAHHFVSHAFREGFHFRDLPLHRGTNHHVKSVTKCHLGTHLEDSHVMCSVMPSQGALSISALCHPNLVFAKDGAVHGLNRPKFSNKLLESSSVLELVLTHIVLWL
jgi:hypothetical protein